MPDVTEINAATGETRERPFTAAERSRNAAERAEADAATEREAAAAAARADARTRLRTATTVDALRDALDVLLA